MMKDRGILAAIVLTLLLVGALGARSRDRENAPSSSKKSSSQQRPAQSPSSASSDSDLTDECPEPNGFFADGYQCDKYYECRDGVISEKLCPDGMVFNDFSILHEKCDLPFGIDCSQRPQLQEPKPTVNCPRLNGYFAHDDVNICDKFFYCVDGKFNMITCPAGLVYNEKTGICTWPDEAKKKHCSSSVDWNNVLDTPDEKSRLKREARVAFWKSDEDTGSRSGSVEARSFESSAEINSAESAPRSSSVENSAEYTGASSAEHRSSGGASAESDDYPWPDGDVDVDAVGHKRNRGRSQDGADYEYSGENARGSREKSSGYGDFGFYGDPEFSNFDAEFDDLGNVGGDGFNWMDRRDGHGYNEDYSDGHGYSDGYDYNDPGELDKYINAYVQTIGSNPQQSSFGPGLNYYEKIAEASVDVTREPEGEQETDRSKKETTRAYRGEANGPSKKYVLTGRPRLPHNQLKPNEGDDAPSGPGYRPSYSARKPPSSTFRSKGSPFKHPPPFSRSGISRVNSQSDPTSLSSLAPPSSFPILHDGPSIFPPRPPLPPAPRIKISKNTPRSFLQPPSPLTLSFGPLPTPSRTLAAPASLKSEASTKREDPCLHHVFKFDCPKVDMSQAQQHPRYPDPEDCQFFYVCINGETPRRNGCKIGQVFNEATGSCDWPRNVAECKDWYKGILTDEELYALEHPKPKVRNNSTAAQNRRAGSKKPHQSVEYDLPRN